LVLLEAAAPDRRWPQRVSTPEPPNTQDCMIVITGGNRGIGLALVELLADSGNKVIFTSRDPARGIEARRQLTEARPNRRIKMEICDLASPDSITHVPNGSSTGANRSTL